MSREKATRALTITHNDFDQALEMALTDAPRLSAPEPEDDEGGQRGGKAVASLDLEEFAKPVVSGKKAGRGGRVRDAAGRGRGRGRGRAKEDDTSEGSGDDGSSDDAAAGAVGSVTGGDDSGSESESTDGPSSEIATAKARYEDVFGKPPRGRWANDLDWLQGKLRGEPAAASSSLVSSDGAGAAGSVSSLDLELSAQAAKDAKTAKDEKYAYNRSPHRKRKIGAFCDGKKKPRVTGHSGLPPQGLDGAATAAADGSPAPLVLSPAAAGEAAVGDEPVGGAGGASPEWEETSDEENDGSAAGEEKGASPTVDTEIAVGQHVVTPSYTQAQG